ncbi:MAG: 5-formyltetrahydrofolate cyclo-ligase [Prevotella sp.]|nr:5-formyltetrahydrofolate cyclo-ligase [Prevotella sp.]
MTDISLFIAALSVRFRPARSPRDTTHWFSTQEVCAAIRDIDPSAKVDATQVFTALLAVGYDFCNRPGTQGLLFKWMFHEKTIQ